MDWLVKRAGNVDVERQHLNRILQEIEGAVAGAGMAYADSLIIDSIADADTTHAPSRNAVFDALALKAPLTGPSVSPVTAVTSASGVLTLNLAVGALFTCTLTENITSIVFSNAPAAGFGIAFSIKFTQHASAAKTITGWPAGLTGHWFGGVYVASTALSAIDEVGLTYYSSTKITGKYAKAAS